MEIFEGLLCIIPYSYTSKLSCLKRARLLNQALYGDYGDRNYTQTPALFQKPNQMDETSFPLMWWQIAQNFRLLVQHFKTF